MASSSSSSSFTGGSTTITGCPSTSFPQPPQMDVLEQPQGADHGARLSPLSSATTGTPSPTSGSSPCPSHDSPTDHSDGAKKHDPALAGAKSSQRPGARSLWDAAWEASSGSSDYVTSEDEEEVVTDAASSDDEVLAEKLKPEKIMEAEEGRGHEEETVDHAEVLDEQDDILADEMKNEENIHMQEGHAPAPDDESEEGADADRPMTLAEEEEWFMWACYQDLDKPENHVTARSAGADGKEMSRAEELPEDADEEFGGDDPLGYDSDSDETSTCSSSDGGTRPRLGRDFDFFGESITTQVTNQCEQKGQDQPEVEGGKQQGRDSSSSAEDVANRSASAGASDENGDYRGDEKTTVSKTQSSPEPGKEQTSSVAGASETVLPGRPQMYKPRRTAEGFSTLLRQYPIPKFSLAVAKEDLLYTNDQGVYSKGNTTKSKSPERTTKRRRTSSRGRNSSRSRRTYSKNRASKSRSASSASSSGSTGSGSAEVKADQTSSSRSRRSFYRP
ncbi:unnamed protein product [Amoebophrya sp. A120]|nr:unnamed protein product [Amoebophrya sp. A120]|eukprot:GSA120T00002526001.1